jgi:hypothetical protein
MPGKPKTKTVRVNAVIVADVEEMARQLRARGTAVLPAEFKVDPYLSGVLAGILETGGWTAANVVTLGLAYVCRNANGGAGVLAEDGAGREHAERSASNAAGREGTSSSASSNEAAKPEEPPASRSLTPEEADAEVDRLVAERAADEMRPQPASPPRGRKGRRR